MWRVFRNRRVMAGALIVLALLVVALWPRAVQVDLAPVARGPLVVTIDEEGRTRVRERFVVSAPVGGRVQRIALEPGDEVHRGMALVRVEAVEPALIDDRTRAELSATVEAARAALGQAQAERARAAAALERARGTLARQRELVAAGAISRDEVEATETEARSAEEALRAAEFSVARAGHELQVARARLQQPAAGRGGTVISSPVDGVVLRRFRESEGVVPAGEPLLEIGNATRLEVVADLLSTDAVRVAPGAAVLIEQWGGDHALRGRVRRVEPAGFMKVSALGVEEQRVNVVVDFDDPDRAGRELGDGYRVEVRIVIWEEQDVLKVPVASLFRRGDDWAVFVLEGGRARLRPVRIGRRSGTEAQVLAGVEQGDALVIHPPDALGDGVRATERGRGE
jgi:HlyD family secretion protein